MEFTLRNGETRTMKLLDVEASIMRTNVIDPAKWQKDGGSLYQFTCRVLIDGHEMTMQRYLPCQESFYEPYVINGMRIWFDAIQEYFWPFKLTHGDYWPMGHAVFAVSDATDPVGPDMVMWYSNEHDFINVEDCYVGDNVWIGAHLGVAPHIGMDINMPKGTPLYAPIDFNYQWLFNAVPRWPYSNRMWAHNNRWRGIRRWPNCSVWVLQAHHMTRLLVEEHTPLKKGTHYAEGAGVASGEADHSHFIFVVDDVSLDPWLLFWQMFEDDKARKGLIHAQIDAVKPGKTGETISFRSDGSRVGSGDHLSYYWTFGDGGWSNEANPTHAYASAGIYPVSLIMDNGKKRHRYTQHITIDGEQVGSPALSLASADEVSFSERQAYVMDVYGCEIQHIPHTLYYVARTTRPKPEAKLIELINAGNEELAAANVTINYAEGSDWLQAIHEGKANQQELKVSVDATGLASGTYTATVTLTCAGALNSPQSFRVSLEVRSESPKSDVIVDDSDPEFFATPYFWVGSRFRYWRDGYRDFYLTNGARAKKDEYFRFTPDLEAGEYRVSFVPETPFPEDSGFWVRVHHADSDSLVWVEPAKSRTIGEFTFDEGTDGFIQVSAEGSKGEVLADAARFERLYSA
ncbi:PKD domain-containing protein [Candidatus Poribacteria bacterium]